MLQAYIDDLCVIGITRKNVEKLTMHQPMKIELQRGVKTMKETTMETILIASVCHEANRAYCLTQGDTSQLPWTDAPEWQRSSAMVGVQKALEGATPRELHESWMAQKAAEGWVHGDVKDAEKKTHPCMVPYHDLPAEQQRKDALFRAVVSALRD